jgi:hypothetical protein
LSNLISFVQNHIDELQFKFYFNVIAFIPNVIIKIYFDNGMLSIKVGNQP